MDIQTASITIGILTACVSVVIGVINSIQSNREAKEQRQTEIETRQAELFMQVYSQWSSKEFQKSYGLVRFVYNWDSNEDWLDKYMPDKNLEAYGDFRSLMTFVNGLGVLTKKELIDLELVEELLGGRIIWFWNVMMPGVDYLRELLDDPLLYRGAEYLGTVLKQRQELAKAS